MVLYNFKDILVDLEPVMIQDSPFAIGAQFSMLAAVPKGYRMTDCKAGVINANEAVASPVGFDLSLRYPSYGATPTATVPHPSMDLFVNSVVKFVAGNP